LKFARHAGHGFPDMTSASRRRPMWDFVKRRI
jgi:hypothetical protein